MIGIVELADCLDSIGDWAGQLAAENVISNKHAFPTEFFGGDSRPNGTLILSDYTQNGVKIAVSGEYRGIESSVKLYAHNIKLLIKLRVTTVHRYPGSKKSLATNTLGEQRHYINISAAT